MTLLKKVFLKKIRKSLESVESAGMSYVDVAGEVTDGWSGKKTPTKVMLVKKFTKALAESDTIQMIQRPNYTWGGLLKVIKKLSTKVWLWELS